MDGLDLHAQHVLQPLAQRHFVALAAILFGEWGPVLLIALYALVWFRPQLARTSRVGDDPARLAVVQGAVASLLALAINLSLSHLIYRPRPFVFAPLAFPALISHVRDSSFPSDHASLTFAVLFVASSAGFPGGVWIWLVGPLVAIGRVLLGVHWLSDVVASAAIGCLAGGLVCGTERYTRPLLVRVVRLAERATPGIRVG